jgi:hypothetical protein
MTIWQCIGPLQIAIVCLAHLPPSQTSPTQWLQPWPHRRHCDIARAMCNRMSCVPPSRSQHSSQLDANPKRERVSAFASPSQIYWQIQDGSIRFSQQLMPIFDWRTNRVAFSMIRLLATAGRIGYPRVHTRTTSPNMGIKLRWDG